MLVIEIIYNNINKCIYFFNRAHIIKITVRFKYNQKAYVMKTLALLLITNLIANQSITIKGKIKVLLAAYYINLTYSSGGSPRHSLYSFFHLVTPSKSV